MSDNIFSFPRGGKAPDTSKPSEEALHIREGLTKSLEQHGDNIRSLLYIIIDGDGNATVGYGGEFAAIDIVGILETIKIELTVRAMLTAKD